MAPSDETPNNGAPVPPPPRRSWFDRLRAGRVSALVAGGIVIASFGGGFLAAKGLDLIKPAAAGKLEPGAEGWSLFGKPRGAGAPRRGVPKPEGFAVWRSRIDSSGPAPMACVEMTRPLDPSKSYGDFVLVAPDLGHAPAVSVKGSEIGRASCRERV